MLNENFSKDRSYVHLNRFQPVYMYRGFVPTKDKGIQIKVWGIKGKQANIHLGEKNSD